MGDSSTSLSGLQSLQVVTVLTSIAVLLQTGSLFLATSRSEEVE